MQSNGKGNAVHNCCKRLGVAGSSRTSSTEKASPAGWLNPLLPRTPTECKYKSLSFVLTSTGKETILWRGEQEDGTNQRRDLPPRLGFRYHDRTKKNRLDQARREKPSGALHGRSAKRVMKRMMNQRNCDRFERGASDPSRSIPTLRLEISLSTMQRLLASRQLYPSEFRCLDCTTKHCIWQLLASRCAHDLGNRVHTPMHLVPIRRLPLPHADLSSGRGHHDSHRTSTVNTRS